MNSGGSIHLTSGHHTRIEPEGSHVEKSAQAYLVQVSVPVLDGAVAIGALTIGIDLDELERVGQ